MQTAISRNTGRLTAQIALRRLINSACSLVDTSPAIISSGSEAGCEAEHIPHAMPISDVGRLVVTHLSPGASVSRATPVNPRSDEDHIRPARLAARFNPWKTGSRFRKRTSTRFWRVNLTGLKRQRASVVQCPSRGALGEMNGHPKSRPVISAAIAGWISSLDFIRSNTDCETSATQLAECPAVARPARV